MCRLSYRETVSDQSSLESLSKLQRKLLGKNVLTAEDLVQYNRDIKSVVNNTISASGIRESKSIRDVNGNLLNDGVSWEKLVSKIPKDKIKAFQTYLVHKHNIDRQNQGKPVTDFSAEESAKAVRLIEKHNPQFIEYSNQINQWWKNFMQGWAVDSGLITKETLNEMNKMYPNYMPTFRIDHAKKMFSSLGNKEHDIRTVSILGKAQSSSKEVVDFRDGFAIKINEIIQTEARNELLNHLYDFANSHPEAAIKYGFTISQNNTKSEAKRLFDDDVVDPLLKKGDDGLYTITIHGDGSNKTMLCEEYIGEALDRLFNPYRNTAIEAVRTATNIPKALITYKNPLFAVFNFARDMQTGIVNSEMNPVKYSMYLVRAAKQITTNGKMYQKYRGYGSAMSAGRYGVDKNNNIKVVPKGVARRAGKKVNNIYDGIISSTEKIPRLAEAMAYINKYGDTQENWRKAAMRAADITVNFSRSGNVTKQVDAFVLYLNASVQAFDKAARQIKKHPIKTIGRASTPAAAIALSGALASFLDGLGGDDDDGAIQKVADVLMAFDNDENPYYQQLKNGIKDKYYCIPNYFAEKDEYGYPKTFLYFPKSQEYGVLFVSLWDRIGRAMSGDKRAFDDFIMSAIDTSAPANPLTQNVPMTFVDIYRNRTFYGGDIVPKSLQNNSPELQYDNTTSEIFKILGKQLGISPMKMQYAVDQFSGIIGDILIPATTESGSLKESMLNVVSKKFTTDPRHQSGVVEEFYNEYDNVTTALEDYRTTHEDEESYNNVVSKMFIRSKTVIGNYQDKIKQIQNNTSLTSEEKKEN